MGYRKNISGQFVYFGLFSTASGLAITSGGASIIGKKAMDGGVQSTVSGVFTEPGSGQYCFQGMSSDFNGNQIGLMFIASGAAPVHFCITTVEGASGGYALVSGQSVNVFSGQLSGQPVDKLNYTISGTIRGKNWAQAMGIIAASVGGQVSGAGTGTERFAGLDAASQEMTVVVDSSGNRTAVTYP